MAQVNQLLELREGTTFDAMTGGEVIRSVIVSDVETGS
jgi:hypothetical protein